MPIWPEATYSYIDRVHFWLEQPLPRLWVRKLQELCGHVFYPQPSRWLPYSNYRQEMELKQVPREALKFLARLQQQVMINTVEWSLDFIFDNIGDKEEATRFHNRHNLQPGRRWREGERFDEHGTRYTLPKHWAQAHGMVNYDDAPCRITGEVYCLHVDWRSYSHRVLVNMGVQTFKDLLHLDHRKFWNKRLRYHLVDENMLGRIVNNWQYDSNRRAPWIVKQRNGTTWDMDLRTGSLLLRGHSVQKLLSIDWPKHVRKSVYRCLTPMSVTHLLPCREGICL